jgi:hypothetical protein
MIERESNNMRGEVHIVLDICDFVADQPNRHLVAVFGGQDCATNDEPDLTLSVKAVDEEGREIKDDVYSPLFIVSVARLRRLCDMAEAMHKVGLDQWAESLGTGAKQ